MKLSIFPLLAAVAFAQTQPAPSFQPDRVLFIDHPVPLAPDLILSIFGNNLGPNTGCASFHDAKGIYPKELCDTQVLVGGIPSELLWAQAGQINFRVPSQTPVEGTADLVVVYQGRSSQAVAMPLRVESPTLALDGPARVGMPVWLRLDMPYYRDSGIRYPYNVFPAAFGCNEVEVRRNGVLLPRMADAGTQGFGGIIGPGNPCGGIGPSGNPRFHGRLPLHLQYRFDQPGTYEVRLTMRRLVRHDVSSVTDWTKIEILPADPGARSRWLADTVAHAPTDAGNLLADFLPSILGHPDDDTLQILRSYLYHPDRVVREYAMYGLTYWPEDQIAPRLWEWERTQGPTDATVRYLLHLKNFAAAHTNDFVEAAIPYLQSDSPVIVGGALYALWLTSSEDWFVAPDIRLRACEALVRAKQHIIELQPEGINNFISPVGQYRMNGCN
jgi:hypothetical protein